MRPEKPTAGTHPLIAGAASVTAGALIAAVGPPLYAGAASFGAPALLAFLVQPGSARARAPRAAFGYGLLAGFVCNALSMYWVVGLLEAFAGFPTAGAVPVAALLWLAQGLVLAFALAMGAALARHGAPLWLCLPALITVCFSYLPTLFPWRPSVGQLSWLPWVQLAELGGEPLLDLLWSLAGTATYETLRRPSRRLVPALVAAVSVAGPAAYGAYRLPQVEAARSVASPLPIGVVQPNIGIEEKHDRRLARSHLHQLRELTASLERRGAELVVWPETAYPYPLDRQRDRQPRGPRRIIGRKVRGPVLTGALTVGGPCERWNSAVVVDRRGAIAGVTDKVRLLAFGEYVPLWHALPPLRERFPCPGLLPGNRPTALEAAGERIGVLNCYEDILGSLARQVMLDRPTVLVNVTNDAWFGDSSEPHIHQLLARMRAIETRRDLVRAVNTGVSSHVSATGAEVERTPTFTDASFVADARPLDMRTPWVRLGDWTSPTLVALLIATALACRPRRRRWA